MKNDSSNIYNIKLSKTTWKDCSDVMLLAVLTVVFQSALLNLDFSGNVILIVFSLVLLSVYLFQFYMSLCSYMLSVMSSVLIYMFCYYSVVNQFNALVPALSIILLCYIESGKQVLISLGFAIVLIVIEFSFQHHRLYDVAYSTVALIVNIFIGILLSEIISYYRVDEFKRKRIILSIMVHDIKSAFSVNYSYASTVMDLISKKCGSLSGDTVSIVSNKSHVVDIDEFSRLTIEVASRSKKDVESIICRLQSDI